MGGHRGSDSSIVLGRGKNATRMKKDFRKKIRNASAVGVATAAVEVIAKSDPTVAALYAAYKLAKFFYPVAEAGVKEYAKTGDSEKAVDKMVEKTGDQIVEKVKEKGVEAVVNAVWNSTKESAGIKTDANVDTAVTTAVSKTVSELIKDEQKN